MKIISEFGVKDIREMIEIDDREVWAQKYVPPIINTPVPRPTWGEIASVVRQQFVREFINLKNV